MTSDPNPANDSATSTVTKGIARQLNRALATASVRAGGSRAVIVGVPAIAIAVGFTPHLAKDGPLLTQAATLIVAVAGIGLTIGGTLVATRRRRLRRRIDTSALVLVTTVLAMFAVGPAVAATNVPRPATGATPASVRLSYET